MIAPDRQRQVLEVEIGPPRQGIDQKLAGSIHGGRILPAVIGTVYDELYDWATGFSYASYSQHADSIATLAVRPRNPSRLLPPMT